MWWEYKPQKREPPSVVIKTRPEKNNGTFHNHPLKKTDNGKRSHLMNSMCTLNHMVELKIKLKRSIHKTTVNIQMHCTLLCNSVSLIRDYIRLSISLVRLEPLRKCCNSLMQSNFQTTKKSLKRNLQLTKHLMTQRGIFRILSE